MDTPLNGATRTTYNGQTASANSNAGAAAGAQAARAADTVANAAKVTEETAQHAYQATSKGAQNASEKLTAAGQTAKAKTQGALESAKTTTKEAGQKIKGEAQGYFASFKAGLSRATAVRANGERPITELGFNSVRIGTAVAVGGPLLGMWCLLKPVTVKVPLSYICFGAALVAGVDLLYSLIYRSRANAQSDTARPLTGINDVSKAADLTSANDSASANLDEVEERTSEVLNKGKQRASQAVGTAKKKASKAADEVTREYKEAV